MVTIVKYFRNVHFAAAKYKEAGGLKIPLPLDVRWNSLVDCLSGYIGNWSVLIKVCKENREEIDKDISAKVSNLGLK